MPMLIKKSALNTAALTQSLSSIYVSTTLALFLAVTFCGWLQDNLKAEYFVYALAVSAAFAIWALIEHKYRHAKSYDNSQ